MDPIPTLAEWLIEVMPTLSLHRARRIDGLVQEGEVSAYWVGSALLRIDLKPDPE